MTTNTPQFAPGINNPVERQIIEKIMDDALAAGYEISVFDGEETTVYRSCDKTVIGNALATTGEDVLRFYKPGALGLRGRIGWVYLIYGNDGWDVIADYLANEKTEAVMKGANALADKLSG